MLTVFKISRFMWFDKFTINRVAGAVLRHNISSSSNRSALESDSDIRLEQDEQIPSPLKNNDEFRTLDLNKYDNNYDGSPLKAYKPRWKDYRQYRSRSGDNQANQPASDHRNTSKFRSNTSRPPYELIENDQATQLIEIKKWLQENTGASSETRTNWKRLANSHLSGYSIEGDILYGIHPIMNALKQQRRSFNKLYIQRRGEFAVPSGAIKEIVDRAGELRLQIHELPIDKLDAISSKRPHQGVCLDASPLPEVYLDVDEQLPAHYGTRHPLWLVLYKIMDPMNMGAILRSAHFMAVDRVIRTRNDSCPLTPVVSKASSGSLESMSLYTVKCRLSELIKAQKDKGWKIVTTSAPSECDVPTTSLESYTLSHPTLLFIGNEGKGIPDSIHNLCDDVLSIQSNLQAGDEPGVPSLNVSVATGIILHGLLSRK